MISLEFIFSELIQKYPGDDALKKELWQEIVENYSGKKRHYHNLTHLENLIQQLSGFKEIIADWDVVLFSIFYHDVVYNTLKQDNEEKSALLAEEKMKLLQVNPAQIEKCKAAIL